MDEIDIKLCKLLMGNSRLSYDELASRLGLSINAVHKRVRALVDLGIVRAFTAKPSLSSLGAISIWVYGRSSSKQIQDAHQILKKNDSTYWVAYSGGEFLYVGGYLRSDSEIDPYISFVKEAGQIIDPVVGILPALPMHSSIEELTQTDYQILSSLHKDARKSLADVAADLSVSAKTVRKRLEKMIERHLIDLTIEWYPDASNDILGVSHLVLAPEGDRMSIFSTLIEDLSPNVLFAVLFSNLPNQIMAFNWANTMKQLEEVRSKIGAINGIDSIKLNVLQTGYSFDTWRDKLIFQKLKSKE